MSLWDTSSIIVYPCHLIDVTLAGEDASSKLVVNFADAYIVESDGERLVTKVGEKD